MEIMLAQAQPMPLLAVTAPEKTAAARRIAAEVIRSGTATFT
jgi:hypothetical protein